MSVSLSQLQSPLPTALKLPGRAPRVGARGRGDAVVSLRGVSSLSRSRDGSLQTFAGYVGPEIPAPPETQCIYLSQLGDVCLEMETEGRAIKLCFAFLAVLLGCWGLLFYFYSILTESGTDDGGGSDSLGLIVWQWIVSRLV